MRMAMLGFASLALLLLCALCSPVRAETIHIATPQGAREAIVLPGKGPRSPTVIVLHGATATAEWTARTSGFTEAAAAHGFASVFPQGIARQWSDGREGRREAVDDVGFLRLLVTGLVDRSVAEPSRIYLAGISNGGMMTYRMLCEASELFAGAATIIASMPGGIGERCHIARPLPIVMFNGTADPMVPYDGGGVGLGGRRGLVWGAERTALFMAGLNGCSPDPQTSVPTSPADEAIHVTRLEWSQCASGQPVALYRFEGGGHQVPGRPAILPALLGPVSQQVVAADVALQLFAGRQPPSSHVD
jgi:polyhydroxybutyrate depolymerase